MNNIVALACTLCVLSISAQRIHAPDEPSTLPSTRPLTLSAPTELTVSVDCQQSVLTWKEVKGADGYVVYRKLDEPNSKWAPIKVVLAPTTNYVEPRSLGDVSREFKVKPIFLNAPDSDMRRIDGRLLPSKVAKASLRLTRATDALSGNFSRMKATWDEPSPGATKYIVRVEQKQPDGWKLAETKEVEGRVYEYTASFGQQSRFSVQALNACSDKGPVSETSDPK